MAKLRNQGLATKLQSTKPKANLVASNAIPAPDTTNLQGKAAYKQDKWLVLMSMLNTLKFEPQFYRSTPEQYQKLHALVQECAAEDAYLVAQCIVYSRCASNAGMRTINQIAAVLLSAYASGLEWTRRFFGLWNKKASKGGCVYRPDDTSEMIAAYSAIVGKPLTNAMKKGFKSVLENLDSYSLLKYKSALIDVINLTHPDSSLSKATVTVPVIEVRDKLNSLIKATKKKKQAEQYKAKLASLADCVGDVQIKTLDAIMLGLSVSADTHEVANSEAGQLVATAVKEGKVTKTEAAQMLSEQKAANFKGLMEDNKLGILAALRNIRQMLTNNPDADTVKKLIGLFNRENILKGKIMPHQLDMAAEVVKAEFSDANSRLVLTRLQEVYEEALPNLTDALTGNNLVIIDMSGSMSAIITDPNRKYNYKTSALSKACLVGATIAKATNADIIRFGSNAEYVKYDPNQNVFSLGGVIRADMGMTNLAAAWKLAAASKRVYTRVFILSDNECNRGNSYTAYQNYVTNCGDPYVYSVDLAAYGTACLAGPKVRYYYGFDYSMFEDIAQVEFNPSYHLDKARKIVI